MYNKVHCELYFQLVYHCTVHSLVLSKTSSCIMPFFQCWLIFVARYVIECPYCGEIYRSRQYWYGNKNPEDAAVRTEIQHVWPGVSYFSWKCEVLLWGSVLLIASSYWILYALFMCNMYVWNQPCNSCLTTHCSGHAVFEIVE